MKIQCALKNCIAVFALFFLYSCGFEVFHVLNPPYNVSLRSVSEGDIPNKFFSFSTAESGVADPGFLGTNVYYRVYTKKLTLTSEVSSINASNAEYSDAGFKKLESFNYQLLSGSSPLIVKNGSNRSIKIRPLTEGDVSNPYESSILINNISSGIPKRSNGDSFSTLAADVQSGSHDDIKESSEPDDNLYYIAAYAASVGMDTNFSPFYSQLAYLGYLTYTIN